MGAAWAGVVVRDSMPVRYHPILNGGPAQMPTQTAAIPDRPLRFSPARPIVGVCLLILLAICIVGCSRRPQYPQKTPDDALRAAIAMVKNGETRKLSDLIYADTPEMRAVLNQLGKVLDSMQKLSVASAKRFPAEFQKLQQDALAVAEDPKNKSLVAQLMVGMSEFGSGSGKAPSRQPNADDIRNAFSAILADPFGWIDRNASRLTTVKTADDTASVMFDGQPAIPVVGLPMKLENGKWYFVLPVNIPPISNVMPRSRQQWSILGSVLKVTDNAMVDLTKDVDAGRVSGLKNLTDKFQDKVLFPIAIAFASYAKELDVRGRTDRRLASFRTRQRAWVDARKKAAPEGTPGVSPKLLEAIGSVAPAKIEQIVRANKSLGGPLGVDKMSDVEFEDLAAGWLAEQGLRVRFGGDLFGDSLEQEIAVWQAERKSKLAASKPPARKK
jgi:hypothetical protein